MKLSEILKKFLIHENDPVQKTVKFKNIDICVEWPKGSTREYKQSNFKKLMLCDYGYIHNTNSEDGEEMDVYLGEDLNSDKIFILTQLDPKTKRFDEYKYMLGFPTKEDAIRTYLKCMDPDFFGGVREKSLEEFLNFFKDMH